MIGSTAIKTEQLHNYHDDFQVHIDYTILVKWVHKYK